MRPIKFRVWDSQRKVMYRCRSIHWENNGVMTFKKGSGIEMDVELGDALLQFTGLLDKNGKEIYDGDILREVGRGWESIGAVYWGCFGCEYEEGIECWMNRDLERPISGRTLTMEVLGNIYETPELLGVKP